MDLKTNLFGYNEQYQDYMERLFPSNAGMHVRGKHTYDISFQVTEECNLRCTYCYQHDKSPSRMKFEDAKKFIDLLLASDERSAEYIQSKECQACILNFIGGEPLLEVDLMDQIIDYFMERTIELHHPWATRFVASVGTNGVLYFDPKVQAFIKKHRPHLSFSITVDGNKKLHDMCRIDLSGKGSFDIAHAAMQDWQKHINEPIGTKITIAPDNLPYMADALIEFATSDTPYIHCNCVYEEGWTLEHAQFFYKELKRVADYLIDHDLVDTTWIALLDQPCGNKKLDDQTWCGGTGLMIALDTHGNIYPCIRYTPSSIGGKQEDFIIGTVEHGFGYTEKERQRIHCMDCVNRRTQCHLENSKKCLDCPIEEGCGDCSAYTYECYGTVDGRTTFHCDMHKARCLAACYYANRAHINGFKKLPKPMNTPRDWALPIIGEEEYEMLLTLADRSGVSNGKHN